MQVIEEGRQEGGRLLREWGLSWGFWGGGPKKNKKNSTPPPQGPQVPLQIPDPGSQFNTGSKSNIMPQLEKKF